jgi:uncharacterized coiled-coil DUF342 family protein
MTPQEQIEQMQAELDQWKQQAEMLKEALTTVSQHADAHTSDFRFASEALLNYESFKNSQG